jgi:hypothetical protein
MLFPTVSWTTEGSGLSSQQGQAIFFYFLHIIHTGSGAQPWGEVPMKLTTYLHLERRLRTVKLYLHSPIRHLYRFYFDL